MSDQLPPPIGAPIEPAAPAGGTPKIIVWAFILSLAGFLILTALAAVAMVLTNWKQMQASGKGKGLAIATLIISGFWLIVMVFAVLSPSDEANENARTDVVDVDEATGESDAAAPGLIPNESSEAGYVAKDAFELFLASDGVAPKATCERYADVFAKYESMIEKRRRAIGNKTEDPRKAEKFISTNRWTSQKVALDLKNDLDVAAATSLSEIENGQFASQPVGRYLRFSLPACEQDLDALERKARQLDSQSEILRQAAANIPWYPKGYSPFGETAWKWTNESCGYSSGYCWTIRVIAQTGCPNGLYAEVNLLQGNTVVGYTNDSLGSLPPGQTAKLEFVSFGGSGTKSATLTKINCY